MKEKTIIKGKLSELYNPNKELVVGGMHHYDRRKIIALY